MPGEMCPGYALTPHAEQRIEERGVTTDALVGALAGVHWVHRGRDLYYCRATRWVVVACAETLSIITVYKLKRSQARRMMAGRGQSGARLDDR